MAYVVSARTGRGDEVKEVHSATMAQDCVNEFRQHGASAVTIRKDGAYLAEAYLPLLMQEEAAAHDASCGGDGA